MALFGPMLVRPEAVQGERGGSGLTLGAQKWHPFPFLGTLMENKLPFLQLESYHQQQEEPF